MKHDREALLIVLGMAAGLLVAGLGDLHDPIRAALIGFGVGLFLASAGFYLYLMLVVK